MKFSCEGFDRRGKPVTEVIEARDTLEATEMLHRRGIFASRVTPQTKAEAPRTPSRARTGRFGEMRRLRAVSSLFRQLSVLLASGTPVADAIAAVERQIRDEAFRTVVCSVRTRVEEGMQFSDALAQHPAVFDGVCRSLVCAGESSGRMDEMLARLSDMIRSQLRTRQTVANAMVYPCLLLLVAVAVGVAMLGFVLPRFEGLFQTLNAPLPTTTRWLMSLSAFIREWWMVLLGTGGVLALVVRLYFSTPRGIDGLGRALLSLPHIGMVLRDLTTARLARVLGVLLTGRVGMVDALRLVKATATLPAYAQLLSRAEEIVTRGESLSEALNNHALITPAVCEAVRSGERSGRVGQVLTQLADSMDEENELRLKTLTGLLEPVILMVMGLVVGSVAISMFLPLFDLTAAGRGAP